MSSIDPQTGQTQEAIICAAEAHVLNEPRYPSPTLPPNTIEFVRNPSDRSVLVDSDGHPVSVDRILATKPLKGELLTRPGPGGRKLTYLAGETVTRTLNDIFGFDGWNLEILKTDKVVCTPEESKRGQKTWHVAYTAHVRITHRKSGTFKEDLGGGDSQDRHLATAVQHAMKASITDALKRAARHFGDKLGNSLYQGTFNVNSAPKTLQEALQMYDRERGRTKFGEIPKPPPLSQNPSNAVAARPQQPPAVAATHNHGGQLTFAPPPPFQPSAHQTPKAVRVAQQTVPTGTTQAASVVTYASNSNTSTLSATSVHTNPPPTASQTTLQQNNGLFFATTTDRPKSSTGKRKSPRLSVPRPVNHKKPNVNPYAN